MIFVISMSQAQRHQSITEIDQITATLMDYIEGTSGVEDPDRIARAFHPDLNLYTVSEKDSLLVRNGKAYITNFEKGEENTRIGHIISIDYENNAAIAKAEIIIPGRKAYVDYFLLLKYQGSWKIIHKSYTARKTSQLK